MTTTRKYEVTCKCGHNFEAELFDSINVTTDPHLKTKLLNGELNVVLCPACGLLFYVEKFIIYHDTAMRQLFYVYEQFCRTDKSVLIDKIKYEYKLVCENMDLPGIREYRLEVFFGLDELVHFLNSSEDEIFYPN